MPTIHSTSPNLRSYDVICVETSAGKDSQAALDEVVARCDRAGVDRSRIIAIHCDLGRVEWKGTRGLAARQASAYGVRFLVVSRRQGDLLDQVRARGKWPGYATRYCTADHKRAQARRVMTALARRYSGRSPSPGAYHLPDAWRLPERISGDEGPIRILDVMGLRAEESPRRAKMAQFTQAKRRSRALVVDEWLPIHGWSEDEVWTRIRASKVPYHAAYDLGMPRLSCVFCIFAGADALALAGAHNAELLREYVRIEREIGHTFKPDLRLADVLERVERGDVPTGRCMGWAA